jgi:hypothetical protein
VPLQQAHPTRLAETQRLLDATDDALVRSNALMRRAFGILSRARQDNAEQRKLLAEFHRRLPPRS